MNSTPKDSQEIKYPLYLPEHGKPTIGSKLFTKHYNYNDKKYS